MKKIFVSGNVTKEIKLEESNGIKYARFSIAINEKRGTEKITTFFDCVCFGKTAEYCANYITKGSKVLCEGNPEIRQYTDKEGIKRNAFSIVVDRIENFSFKDTKASNIEMNINNEEQLPF